MSWRAGGRKIGPKSGVRNRASLGALAQGNVCLNGDAVIFTLPVSDREIQQFDETAVCQGKLNLKLSLVDITEDEKEYLIKAELSEMKKEDVWLTVESDVLAVSGERKFEKEEKGKKYHRVERAYESFVRSFSLPTDADGSRVSAKTERVVLRSGFEA